jgi:hypothetical protein
MSRRHPLTGMLAPGCAVTLPQEGGELWVVSGEVWLTFRGDSRDHFLRAGARRTVPPDAGAVIEPARRGVGAQVQWFAPGEGEWRPGGAGGALRAGA